MVGVTRWRTSMIDLAVAASFTVFCVFVTIAIAQDSTDPFDGWTVALIVAIGASLLGRRRWPEAVLVVCVAGLTLYSIAGYAGGPVYLAPLIPVATIAATGDRRRTAIAVIGTMVAFLVVAAAVDGVKHVGYLLAFAGWLLGAVFVGTAHHNRQALLRQLEQRARDLEETREEEARRRVVEERLRIARDLHDSVAHGIAAINLQAGAALHVLDRRPEQARPALTAIRELSGETLQELRAAVGVLRDDEAGEGAPRRSRPALERVVDLVEHARRAGLTVDLRCESDPAGLPVAVEVAAYRIVQESLTNVMRHAGPAAHAVVSVQRADDALTIEVTNDGRAEVRRTDPSLVGHGLAGMQERAATVGGELDAGPRPGGGFRVRARLPLEETVP